MQLGLTCNVVTTARIYILAFSPTYMQQRRVYDRRSTQDRTTQAVQFASSVTAGVLGGGSEVHEEVDTYEIGDIVGMVSKGSTLREPKVLIGKVLRTDRRKREALLAYLQPIPHTRNHYRLKIGEETWRESYQALVYPLDVVYEEQKDIYILRTPLQHIHTSVLTD